MNRFIERDLDYYLGLNYEVTLRRMSRAESGSDEVRYLARISLISGLMAEGTTAEEALANLESVKRLAFELMLKQGKEIPEPEFDTMPV